MINGLQIIVNMPLFFVQFPELSSIIINGLIDIATFDVIDTDLFFEKGL